VWLERQGLGRHMIRKLVTGRSGKRYVIDLFERAKSVKVFVFHANVHNYDLNRGRS